MESSDDFITPRGSQDQKLIHGDDQKPVIFKRPNPFAYIFVDYSMPGMNGDQLTSEIRNLEQKYNMNPSKIIGLSANSDKETIEKCLKSGMNQFEIKPIKRD